METMERQIAKSLSSADFFKQAFAAGEIAVDTETNGEDIRDGRGFARGVSIAFRSPVGVLSRYFAFRHNDEGDVPRECLSELKEYLENYKGRVYFHNAKFDLVSLGTLGITYTGHFVDTMLLAHLVDENRPPAKSLDACTKYYLKDEGKKKSPEFEGWVTKLGWADVPSWLMDEYAAYDTDLTLRLGEHLVTLADKEKLMEYWPHKERFVRLIVMMENNGVRIDTDICNLQANLGRNTMADVLEILGYDNLGPKAYASLFLDKMGLPEILNSKTNRRTFDKSAMARYEEILERSDDPTAAHVLTYRGWQKSVTSNYEPYISLLSPDGRLRPNYKLHGTRTGRMSCEKPNLQNVPRSSSKPWNGSLKKAFIADSGYTLLEFDYSQLELRLASAYADQQNLKEVFADGRDIFTEMSQQLGMSRQDTKTLTYTIQYGGGVNRLIEVFGVTQSRARYLIDNFYATYPGFKRVSGNAKMQVVRTGKVRLWSGRYRHFFFGAEESHKSFNSVVQGGAADIMERTMLRVADAVGWENNECRMLLQVHDSLVMEVLTEKKDHYISLISEAMTNVEPDFGVRWAIDCHIWGE